METQTFTFHAKFGDAMKVLPRDAADEFAAALVRFGCFGEEPDFENPYLAALFSMAREDIVYSIKKRSNGAKGGRARNHAAEEVSEVVSENEKPKSEVVSETEKPKSEVVSETEKPKSEVVSENEKAKSEVVFETEKAKSEVVFENEKAKQTNIANSTNSTNSTNKREGGARMARPTLQEVEAEIDARGYHVDARAFIAYYDSNGWKVGKNPMKSWKSALTTWERRDSGKVVARDADFSRFG